jgi:hypothetical protein
MTFPTDLDLGYAMYCLRQVSCALRLVFVGSGRVVHGLVPPLRGDCGY